LRARSTRWLYTPGAFAGFSRACAAVGEVRLEAQDGADLLLLRRLVEAPRAVHVAVVGDGQAVLAELPDVLDEVGNPARAVEQRVLAVRVEVDERHRSAHPSLELVPDRVECHALRLEQHEQV